MADRKQGAGFISGSSAAVHKANCLIVVIFYSIMGNAVFHQELSC